MQLGLVCTHLRGETPGLRVALRALPGHVLRRIHVRLAFDGPFKGSGGIDAGVLKLHIAKGLLSRLGTFRRPVHH